MSKPAPHGVYTRLVLAELLLDALVPGSTRQPRDVLPDEDVASLDHDSDETEEVPRVGQLDAVLHELHADPEDRLQ